MQIPIENAFIFFSMFHAIAVYYYKVLCATEYVFRVRIF